MFSFYKLLVSELEVPQIFHALPPFLDYAFLGIVFHVQGVNPIPISI